MVEISIRPELTPNPQTMRFSSSVELTDQPSEFKSAQETLTAPLARKLFGFPWTAAVFIGRDFVTVTKQEWVDWETLAEPLAGLISEHLERGEPVITKSSAPASGIESSAGGQPNANSSNAADANDSAAVQAIKRVINQEIRPAVAQDGGDVAFSRFEDGIVYLFMQGSCAGCPSATMTLKMGIEARLKEAVPEVREVISLT